MGIDKVMRQSGGDKVIREARALPVNFSDQAPNVKLNLKTAIETTNAHE